MIEKAEDECVLDNNDQLRINELVLIYSIKRVYRHEDAATK
jgi:hypothetical protein